MTCAQAPFSAGQLTLLVPMKDRPDCIRGLLESLEAQTVACGRIVIVDGGRGIDGIVGGFSSRLPIRYLKCDPPRQIRQRNLGMQNLDPSARLVGFLDDDLVVESDALEQMLAFWNRTRPTPAGVAFNIVNTPARLPSLAGRLFLMDSDRPGRVLSSG